MQAMEELAPSAAALAEAVVFLSYFKDLKDPRQQGKVSYPLDEILLLCLLAVLAGAETVTDIALFGVKKLAFLPALRNATESRSRPGGPAELSPIRHIPPPS
jgi:DDE_Tnp_1-associated